VNDKKVTLKRRGFLKAAGATIATVALMSKTSEASNEKNKEFGFYIDVDKCYGCMGCVVACAEENHVPLNSFRTKVRRQVENKGKIIFVPIQCNHCINPPCVKPCPVNATYKGPDGLVVIDENVCIGCGKCVKACPYNARFLDPIRGIANKCSFCDHRIYSGKLPACVEACPTSAKIFGDLNSDGEVSKSIKANKTSVRNPEFKTKPKIFFKSLPKKI
jgi:Fe-S-cluster-containing dehydrogenase component